MDTNSKIDSMDAPFGLHMGKMIKQFIEKETNFTKTLVAMKLGLTRTCFSSRLSSPHYGNIHDLIKISILLEKDFISPALALVRNQGVASTKMFSERELNEVQMKLALTEKKLFEKDRELTLTHELLEKYRLVAGA